MIQHCIKNDGAAQVNINNSFSARLLQCYTLDLNWISCVVIIMAMISVFIRLFFLNHFIVVLFKILVYIVVAIYKFL